MWDRIIWFKHGEDEEEDWENRNSNFIYLYPLKSSREEMIYYFMLLYNIRTLSCTHFLLCGSASSIGPSKGDPDPSAGYFWS